MISSATTLPNKNIIYTHAAATPNNKFAIISATGYAAAADCLAAQAAPTTTAPPTSVLPHSSGKVLVAYGRLTAASNFIYSYDVDPTTNAISNPVAAYTDFTVVNGPSTMVEDPSTHEILVSNATSTFNSIEKFKLNAATGTLTREGNSPFIAPSIYTRCPAAMLIPY